MEKYERKYNLYKNAETLDTNNNNNNNSKSEKDNRQPESIYLGQKYQQWKKVEGKNENHQ